MRRGAEPSRAPYAAAAGPGYGAGRREEPAHAGESGVAAALAPALSACAVGSAAAAA